MKQRPPPLRTSPSIPSQRGAVALITALVLLLVASIGTVYLTRTSLMDQRVAANEIRAKSAFEAADAGYHFALAFLDVDNRDIDDDGIDDRTELLGSLGITDDMSDGSGLDFDDCNRYNNEVDKFAQVVCDPAERQEDASGNKSLIGYRLQAIWDPDTDAYNWSVSSSGSACDTTASNTAGTVLPVRICLLIQRGKDFFSERDVSGHCKVREDTKRVVVTSTGYSEDRQAIKQITQTMRYVSPFPGDPGAATHALIAYDGVAVSGSMQVVNAFSNATIWCGSEVSSFGSGPNSGTLIHPNPGGPTVYDPGNGGDLIPFFDADDDNAYDTDEKLLDYTANSGPYTATDFTHSSGVFEAGVTVGPDVIDNASSLRCDKTADPDCFFRNFLAGSPDFIKSGADYVTSDTRLEDPEGELGVDGSFIWVDARNSDGTLNEFGLKNGTYGSVEEPVFLVIDGDFDPQASPTIYGIVYVRGDVVGGGSGGGLVIGSMIVEGDNGFDDSGGMDIIYDPNVIGRAGGGGNNRRIAATLPGTWRDQCQFLGGCDSCPTPVPSDGDSLTDPTNSTDPCPLAYPYECPTPCNID